MAHFLWFRYVGEMITSDEAEERGKKYDAEGRFENSLESMKFFVSSFGLNNGTSFARTYLFDLDFNRGDQNLYTVDAAFYGNLSHFINHRFIQIILKLSYLFILQL